MGMYIEALLVGGRAEDDVVFADAEAQVLFGRLRPFSRARRLKVKSSIHASIVSHRRFARRKPLTTNNTWGFGYQRRHIHLRLDRQHNASMYMPIANRYYESVQGFRAQCARHHRHFAKILSDHRRYRQVDCFGNYTAGLRPHALHSARCSRKNIGTRPPSSPNPPVISSANFKWSPAGADFIGVNSKVSRQRRRMDAPIAAEAAPTARFGSSTGTFHRPAQTPRARFSPPAGAALMKRLCATNSGRIYRIVHKDANPTRRSAFDNAQARNARRHAQERQPLLAHDRPAPARRTRQQNACPLYWSSPKTRSSTRSA